MITAKVLLKNGGMGEKHENKMAEMNALTELVDEFSANMKDKLYHKVLEGCTGWDNPDFMPNVKRLLGKHVERLLAGDLSQAVDVANLAAMLWNFKDLEVAEMVSVNKKGGNER